MTGWTGRELLKNRGFTVVEVLIVVAVIGVLAAVTLVSYGAVVNIAKDASLKSDLQRLADELKLESLDTGLIPIGGATSSLTGDSTILPGVSLSPAVDAYDLTGTNLFYCAGPINGSQEFGLFAKGTSGKIFSIRSNQAVKELPEGHPMSHSGCTAIGFSAPYTWSYGYNPNDQYKWFAWANGSAEIITNLATNPSAEGSGGWLSNNGAIYPVSYSTTVKRTGSRAIQSSNLGASTVLLSVYAPGAPDGNGIVVSSGGNYMASVYVRAEVSAQARLGAQSRSGGVWSTVNYGEFVPVSANEWVRVSHTVDIPGNADRVRHILTVHALVSQPAGTKAYADDMMFTAGTTQWLFRQGGFNGWTWNGTAHASTSNGPGQAFN